jgi:hypothetical protein
LHSRQSQPVCNFLRLSIKPQKLLSMFMNLRSSFVNIPNSHSWLRLPIIDELLDYRLLNRFILSFSLQSSQYHLAVIRC